MPYENRNRIHGTGIFTYIFHKNQRFKCLLGGGFKYFVFSSLFGEDSQFDEHIFQRGFSTTNQSMANPDGGVFQIPLGMTQVPMATIAVGLAPIIPMANLVVVQQEIVEPTVPWLAKR